MRKNLPVSNEEIFLKEGDHVVSKTDTKGLITYVNNTFMEISGFCEEELIGSPHNIVRHPDMPEAGFKDLWDTVKAGRPWVGLVKNRTKSGAFYWVKATATAMQEDGKITGYMSVRTRPTSEEVRAADTLYRRINAGGAKDIFLRGGKARKHPNFLQKFLGVFTASLRTRLLTVIGLLSVATLVIALVGLVGLSRSNDRLRAVYEDRLVPITQLSEISDRMRQNITLVILAGDEGLRGKGESQLISANTAQVQTNIDRITELWQAYMATEMTAEGAKLSQDYLSHRGDFVKSGLKPAIALINNGRFEEVNSHISNNVIPLFNRAKADNDKLIELQKKIAADQYIEARSDYHKNLWISLGAMLLAFALAAISYRSISAAIVNPLKKLVESFSNIARGFYDEIIDVDREDEIGIALQDVNALQIRLGYERDEAVKTQAIREAEREDRLHEEEARRAEKQAEQEALRLAQEARVKQLNELTANFDTKISAVLKSVDSAASELNSSAHRMTGIASDTSMRTQTVAAASEQASSNVQTVAVAAEELSASISEISRQVTHSSRISEQAVERANNTNETMRKLEGSAQKISAVVNLISDIAEQTNLLALNATIEAARAGEAGKGFAVVASEVKGLANQTAKATDDISSQVLDMQTVTSEAVKAIDDIIATIRDVRDVATAIATAVEEQGSATQEIARNVQEAAKGTDEVNRNIGEVTSAAAQTGKTATEVQSAADALGQQSESLRGEVDGFLSAVKAI